MKLGMVARIDCLDHYPKDVNRINYMSYFLDYFRKRRNIVLFDWRDVSENLEVSKHIFGDYNKVHFRNNPTNLNGICDFLFVKQLGDIHKTPKQFMDFLSYLNKFEGIIVNPIETMRDNLSKQYLLDLQKEGFPIIPSIEIKRVQDLDEMKNLDFSFSNQIDKKVEDLVLKPKIFGEQGSGVRRLSSFEKKKELSDYLEDYSPVIVQPLINEIFSEGESSFIFLGNQFSHGVHKITGNFLVNFCPTIEYKFCEPTKRENELCHKILSLWPHKTYYSRIDMIRRKNKPSLISEVEVLNPAFYIEDLGICEKFSKKLEKHFLGIERNGKCKINR